MAKKLNAAQQAAQLFQRFTQGAGNAVGQAGRFIQQDIQRAPLIQGYNNVQTAVNTPQFTNMARTVTNSAPVQAIANRPLFEAFSVLPGASNANMMKQYSPTIGKTVDTYVAKPLGNIFNPKANVFEKSLSGIQLGWNVTPTGILTNLGTGFTAGTLQAIRTGKPLDTSIKNAIGNNSYIAEQGLGVGEKPIKVGGVNVAPLAALAINVAAGNPKGGIKQLAKLKNLESVGTALKGVNPKAFDLHPQDAEELAVIGEKMLRKIPLNFQENASLERSFARLFPKINLEKTSNKKVQQIIAATLDRYNKIPKGNMTQFPAMGLVDNTQPLGGAKNTPEGILNKSRLANIQEPVSNTSPLRAGEIPQTGQILGSKQTPLKVKLEEGTNTSSGQSVPQSVDGLLQKVKSKIDSFYTSSLDRFHPISKLGKQAGQDQAMRNALTGYYGARSIGKYHTDFELSPILKSVDHNDLRAYTVAQRDLELAGRDIQGSNTGDATKILEGLKQKYGGDLSSIDTAANKLYDYQKNMVQKYLVDTGIISKENFDSMVSKNQKYVPFKRVMDQVDEFLGVPPTKGAGSVGSQNIIKGIKGSKKDIVDPLQSIIENTYKTVGLGQRQKVAQTIIGLKDQLPKGTIQKFTGSEVGKNPVISLFENGKVQKYLVPSEVADAAKGLSEEGMNTIVKILAAPTKIFRATATGLNPEFALPNITRDLQSTFINNGLNPLKFVSGLAHYMKKDEVYQEFLRAGGQTSRMSLNQPFLKQSVQDLAGQKRALRLVDPRRIKSVLEAVGQASEQPTRIASFQDALQKALKKGVPLEEARAQAAYAAQEGSVNFARRGSQTQGFNAIYAFLNARAQGVDRLVRSFKANPKGVTLRVGMITAAPAIALYAYNRNYPSYFDPRIVPDYVKQNNFVIMLGDKPIPELGGAQYITIPKGDVGKLANPLEAFMSYADGRGGDVQSALASVLQGFSPISNVGDIIPTALRPVIENKANYSFFTGRQIVPDSKLNYPKPYQSNKNTSAIYKQAGQLINQSPNMIENLSRGYLTGFARIGEMAAAPFAKQQTSAADVNKTPILRRFLQGEQRTEEEQLLNDSYKLKDIQQKIQDIRTGVKYGNIPEDAGLRAIEELQKQGETEVKKQSFFGPSSASAASETPAKSSLTDQFKIDNIRYDVKNSGKPQEYKGVIYYPKGDKTYAIDLSTKLEPPKLTGSTELDKQKLSKYSGQITTKINEVVKLSELKDPNTGKSYLTSDEAERLISGLKQKLSDAKGEKAVGKFELTGQPNIDKEIISSHITAISNQINEVVDYVQKGKLTAQEGEQLIQKLKDKQKQVRYGGGGKGKKPKALKISMPKITARVSKAPTLRIKSPKIRIPKYRPIKPLRIRGGSK